MVVTARKCWCINSPPGLRQKTYWFHDWYFDQEGCSQKKPLEESDWMEGLYKIYFPSGQRPQLFWKVSSHFWQILQSGCYCEKICLSHSLAPSWLGLPLITWCHNQLCCVHSSFQSRGGNLPIFGIWQIILFILLLYMAIWRDVFHIKFLKFTPLVYEDSSEIWSRLIWIWTTKMIQ